MNDFLQQLIGKWQGHATTWFEPGTVADASDTQGEFSFAFNDMFLRHVYTGSIQNKPRQGEELIAWNSITKNYQLSWIDSFHMNYAIMFSEGKAQDIGFTVFGKYDVAPDHPPWGWRSEYSLNNENQLTITAYNVTPQGEEQKAIETIYNRTT